MQIRVSIATDVGWQRFNLTVPDGFDYECRSQPSRVDRIEFWSRKAKVALPKGRTVVWEVIRRMPDE